MPTATAVIVAGGSGARLRSATPKQFLPVLGKPLLAHTLEPFLRCGGIESIVLVLPRQGFEDAKRVMEPYARKGPLEMVPGGGTRQESVWEGLTRVDGGLVAVHDGARPLVSPEIIARVVAASSEHGGAIAAVPVVETLKEVHEHRVVRTVERERYYRAQTPQCFRVDVLRRAFTRAFEEGFVGTDEASLVERLGGRIEVVAGSEANVKVTTAEDMARVVYYLEKGG